MDNVVIVAGARTPVGSFGGTLKSTPVVELGALVLKEALKRAGLRPVATEDVTRFEPDLLKGKGMVDLEKKAYDYGQSLRAVRVDEVIMGNVVGAGQGQNVARQASIKAGIAKETNAFTINKVCASGMKAIALAAQSIRAGDAEVVLAGGMENMSLIPFSLPAARWGARMNNTDLVDLMVFDGLFEIFYGYHMGITAENIAALYGISRKEQDELGALSHQRARKAIADGLFKEEIVPVIIPQRKGDPIVFDTDERPMDTTVEKMGKIPPAFKKDGTVTAGNASGINDAAAALLVMSEKKAKEYGLKPLVKIRAYATGGVDPAYMGIGPVPAVRKILQREKLSMNDFGTVELNEAFASQAIACIRELKCDPEKTNLLGSGISIGHPIGCSGARLVVTLTHEMIRKGHALGLACLCIGGGQGMAMVLEQA
ncbi:MAG: acetyl-CoA C-acyltransferase [Deltaproteobacteria bacterium HGW-Deltaproteobacteria-15]|jgi:acetyl-CoA C-acetyltransferase|nr:MAG: acetyl-CoA C-acyltransferase [Deltaproteobacteria bacterium HGW-Deltaproteobacteria-15]